MDFKIFVINPGSTSTKLAVYNNNHELVRENISHTSEDLSSFPRIIEQLEYRLDRILDFIKKHDLTLGDFSCIVARGGLLKPIPSGTYEINEQMLNDLSSERFGSHASNLGALLANRLANQAKIPAFIVDPVVVDELDPIVRITGRPEITRKSIFHALNHKAIAKRFAAEIKRPYEELNLIVAHLGGGITIGCHKEGRIVEVNNGLDGEGPFSPERAGTVQAKQFGELILNQKWNLHQISRALAGEGGLVAHLGTSDVREVELFIAEGNEGARIIYDAMIYQICRYIAAAAIPVRGNVDYILLTGGIAYSNYLTQKVKEYVEFIAQVVIIPGEDELQALVEGVLRVLNGQEKARKYEK